MSDKKQISFIAQHRRGAIVFIPIFPLLIAVFLLIVLLLSKDQSQSGILIATIAGLTIFSISLFFLSLFLFFHKLTIKGDEIILKGITGIIKRYKKTDIKNIVFRSNYGRSNVPYLIIEDNLSDNRYPNSIINKRGEYIKLDCNKERVKIITEFWDNKIEGLPEKFRCG